jgi:hypothetical protein
MIAAFLDYKNRAITKACGTKVALALISTLCKRGPYVLVLMVVMLLDWHSCGVLWHWVPLPQYNTRVPIQEQGPR